MNDRLTEEEDKACGRAWEAYKERLYRGKYLYPNRGLFFTELQQHVCCPFVLRVIKWPGNWPEVEQLFTPTKELGLDCTGTRNFTKAVEAALKKEKNNAESR